MSNLDGEGYLIARKSLFGSLSHLPHGEIDMNFQQLKDQVVNMVGKDLEHSIEYFIQSGQLALERELRLSAMLDHHAVLTLASGVNSITLSSNFIELKYICIVDGTTRYFLKEQESDLSMLESNRNHREDTTNTGRPTRYRILKSDNILEFNRYTDKAYKHEAAEYHHLSELTNPSDTNWWTTNAYDVLLFAALVESIPFLDMTVKESRGVRAWVSILSKKIEDLRVADSREKLSGGRKRTRYVD